MIVNNFLAMRRTTELRSGSLTPKLAYEIHCRVTDGTIDDPAEARGIQRPGDSHIRIVGGASSKQLLHIPSSAVELPKRLEELCTFANTSPNNEDGPCVPPLARSITLHFMMGHDHYFTDGNGRTARAVFYWSMFDQGFFLAEYPSVSRLLLEAPTRYARSSLYIEQDEGDLIHLLLEQVKIIERTIIDLDGYPARKTRELKQFDSKLRTLGLNHRRIALLEAFVRDPGTITTVAEHQHIHGISNQTAHTDLQDLYERGYLHVVKSGKAFI